MGASKLKPFEQLGGREVMAKIVKRFYDKVYDHPWIGQYFKDVPREHIENQQMDFMSGSLGGPRAYFGKMPADAHTHMMINDELFDLRNRLLEEALHEEGVPPELRTIWLSIDESFRRVIVKDDPSQCQKRFATDTILNFKKPGP